VAAAGARAAASRPGPTRIPPRYGRISGGSRARPTKPQQETLYIEFPLRATRPLARLPGGPSCPERDALVGPCPARCLRDYLQVAVKIFSLGDSPTLTGAIGLFAGPGRRAVRRLHSRSIAATLRDRRRAGVIATVKVEVSRRAEGDDVRVLSGLQRADLALPQIGRQALEVDDLNGVLVVAADDAKSRPERPVAELLKLVERAYAVRQNLRI
jgi:hypothetical protein